MLFMPVVKVLQGAAIDCNCSLMNTFNCAQGGLHSCLPHTFLRGSLTALCLLSHRTFGYAGLLLATLVALRAFLGGLEVVFKIAVVHEAGLHSKKGTEALFALIQHFPRLAGMIAVHAAAKEVCPSGRFGCTMQHAFLHV